MNTLRIATRKSPLALWQAEHVAARLREAHDSLQVELVTMTTKGDRILDAPLAKVGGKGLFVKELEQGMLEGRADIAVHSMKDVPVEFPDGLGLYAILAREDPFDAFVSNQIADIESLPEGAVVGTSSLRRKCQLLAKRPDLELRDLRGNVNTRLAKLDAGEYDAIILASAGLKRLQMAARIRQRIPAGQILPAIGQGAIGIETRIDDGEVCALLDTLIDADTTARVVAERAMNERLAGGCQVPIAGFAELHRDELFMRGLVGEPDGSRLLSAEGRAAASDADALGVQIAEQLLAQGAGEILGRLMENH